MEIKLDEKIDIKKIYNIYEIDIIDKKNNNINEIILIVLISGVYYMLSLNIIKNIISYEKYESLDEIISYFEKIKLMYHQGNNYFNFLNNKVDFYEFIDYLKQIIKIKNKGINIGKDLFIIRSNYKSYYFKIYNLKLKKVTHTINGYKLNKLLDKYFLVLSNGDIKSNNKILLCSCNNNQKENGILIIKLPLDEKEKILYKFYKTNFKIICFCPILVNNKDIKFILTNGFRNINLVEEIKLYKIYLSENFENINIEWIKDIIIEINAINENVISKENKENNRFKNQINYLTQSKFFENILATTYDGNHYLLTPPNINSYLEK